MSQSFDPMMSFNAIASFMGWASTHMTNKQLLQYRKLMDPFLDQLIKDSDPLENIREANKIMVMKNE